jgi:hypothetical protein
MSRGPEIGGKIIGAGRGETDRGKYRKTAGPVTKGLMFLHHVQRAVDLLLNANQ